MIWVNDKFLKFWIWYMAILREGKVEKRDLMQMGAPHAIMTVNK